MYRALKLNKKQMENTSCLYSVCRILINKTSGTAYLLGFVLSAIALAYVVSKHESSAGKTA